MNNIENAIMTEFDDFDSSKSVNFYGDNNGVVDGNKISNTDIMNIKLIYVGKNSSKLVEYAGRICYNSYDKMTENSFADFIKGIVLSGHESVIEHTNLVYAIKNFYYDVSNRYSEICESVFKIVSLNPLVKINNVNGVIFISGNLRVFKDLCREWYRRGNIKSKVIEYILESFYTMPKFFFEDMIKNKIMEESKFLAITNNERVDMYDDISPRNITNEVTLLSSSLLYLEGKLLPRESTLTFEITEPRYTSHQEVRHRLSSYSQQSQRYINFSKGVCYIPEHLPEVIKDVMETKFEEDFNTYENLLKMGVKKEDARIILPEATMSKLIVTRNIENWKHYLHERTSPRAQEYIREKIAKPIKQVCESLNII